MYRNIFLKIKYSYSLAKIYSIFKYRKFSNNNVYVNNTSGKGSGLFTTKCYKKGQLVFLATGPVIIEHFSGNDCYKYPDWYAVDKDVWIDIKPPFVKINHSCKPNLGIDFGRCFVALRDIKPNDELTFDYSFTDDEIEWVMGKDICKCGEDNCRTIIGSVHNVPKEYFDYSYPYIQKYFQDIYNKQNIIK